MGLGIYDGSLAGNEVLFVGGEFYASLVSAWRLGPLLNYWIFLSPSVPFFQFLDFNLHDSIHLNS